MCGIFFLFMKYHSGYYQIIFDFIDVLFDAKVFDVHVEHIKLEIHLYLNTEWHSFYMK